MSVKGWQVVHAAQSTSINRQELFRGRPPVALKLFTGLFLEPQNLRSPGRLGLMMSDLFPLTGVPRSHAEAVHHV